MEQPTIEFQVKGPDGNAQPITDHAIFQQLAQGGFAPLAISPDGQTVSMQDQQGQYDLPMATVLQNLGLGEIVGGKPLDADYENVEPGWRALVHKLPNDAQRKELLTQILTQRGIENPQLMGSGRDWHLFNPTNNSWMGITNSPDWDSSDLVEAGLEIPRFAASGLAGGGAAALTGGNPFAGMAGAAAGGGAVDALERGAMALLSPEYRNVVSQNAGENVADIAKGAAFDAAGFGVGKLAGKALGAATRGGASAVAPASALARGAGATSRIGGGLVEDAAGMLDGPVMSDLATTFVPGAAEAQGIGYLAEAPAWLAKQGARAMNAVGETDTMQRFAPSVAGKLRGTAQNLMRPRAPMSGVGPQPLSAKDVYGNLAEEATAKVRGFQGAGPHPEELMDQWRRASVAARKAGASPQEARAAGDQAAKAFERRFILNTDAPTKRAGEIGEKFGEYANLAEEGGRRLGRAAVGATRGGIKSVKALGGLARGTGEAAEAFGNFARPIEQQAYGRMATDRALEEPLAWAEEQWQPPWSRKPRRANMLHSTLAGN